MQHIYFLFYSILGLILLQLIHLISNHFVICLSFLANSNIYLCVFLATEMSSHLPSLSRIRKRRQKDVSLFMGCCCPPFLMTINLGRKFLINGCLVVFKITTKSSICIYLMDMPIKVLINRARVLWNILRCMRTLILNYISIFNNNYNNNKKAIFPFNWDLISLIELVVDGYRSGMLLHMYFPIPMNDIHFAINIF